MKQRIGLFIFFLLGPPIGYIPMGLPTYLKEGFSGFFMMGLIGSYFIGFFPALFTYLFHFFFFMRSATENTSFVKVVASGFISGLTGSALFLIFVILNQPSKDPLIAVAFIILGGSLAGILCSAITEIVTPTRNNLRKRHA